MATTPVLHQASDADCSVCYEPFKEPKILPCGHVVCRHCLLSWLRAQPEAGCPLCRYSILETEGQSGSLEEEVGALPTDLALAELVEARAFLDKDHTCNVCEDVAAAALCLHCPDMLCASCAKAHVMLSVYKHHKVQDLSSLTPDALANSRQPPCSSHPDKEGKLFCPTHGLSVCAMCAAARHNSCPYLKDLEEKTEEARAALALMAASLSASESKLKDAIQQLDRHIQDNAEGFQVAITDIQKTCDRLEAAVKTCRGRMADLVRHAAAEIQDKRREAIVILQGRKSRVTSHTAVVKRAQESKAPVTVSDMHSVMQTRVPMLDCSVTLPATLTFVIEKTAVRDVERALEKLGQVKLVTDVESQTGEFAFHKLHGSSIVLSNSGLTATHKVGSHGHGIVLSRDPMVENVMYQVRLDLWVTGGLMVVGVLRERPDHVDFPMWSHQLRFASLVCPGYVKLGGADGTNHHNVYEPKHPAAAAMKGLGLGQRVGVSLDASRQVHLHVDGNDRGVWDTVGKGPIYVIIDLLDSKNQVTFLPPTPLHTSSKLMVCL